MRSREPRRHSRKTTRAERWEIFFEEALEAEREMDLTGLHYMAEDVFQYITARAHCQRAPYPMLKPWRK